MPKGPLDHLFPDTEDDMPFANDAERSAFFDKIFGRVDPGPADPLEPLASVPEKSPKNM